MARRDGKPPLSGYAGLPGAVGLGWSDRRTGVRQWLLAPVGLWRVAPRHTLGRTGVRTEATRRDSSRPIYERRGRGMPLIRQGPEGLERLGHDRHSPLPGSAPPWVANVSAEVAAVEFNPHLRRRALPRGRGRAPRASCRHHCDPHILGHSARAILHDWVLLGSTPEVARRRAEHRLRSGDAPTAGSSPGAPANPFLSRRQVRFGHCLGRR